MRALTWGACFLALLHHCIWMGSVCAQPSDIANGPGMDKGGQPIVHPVEHSPNPAQQLHTASNSVLVEPASNFSWAGMQTVPDDLLLVPTSLSTAANIESFTSERFDRPAGLFNRFTDFPEFEGGLTILSEAAALKVGGYVKADLITDFNAIGSTDTFDTGTIEIGSPDRRNSRLHARQTRLSFDTRWKVSQDIARAFVEVDFFGNRNGVNDALRLRHAYGTIGNLTAGQTWTTFTDPSAVPQTLDVEGTVSNVNRRQGLVRIETPLAYDGFSVAASIENPSFDVEIPPGVQGEGRTETPDFVARIRYDKGGYEFQIAGVLRELGFQPVGDPVINGTAWGFNFTGSVRRNDRFKGYYQITFGEGIGSYRGSPDVVATSNTTAELLPVFGWMVGFKQRWSDRVFTNVTYSELHAESVPGQAADNLKSTSYLAVNLIQNPYERVFWGIEYLYGTRQNQSLDRGSANRLQVSCGFFLP